jgi:serine/threonine protein kinase
MHLDIRPENIFMREKMDVSLGLHVLYVFFYFFFSFKGDFGTACSFDLQTTFVDNELTEKHRTGPYTAPEAQNKQCVLFYFF